MTDNDAPTDAATPAIIPVDAGTTDESPSAPAAIGGWTGAVAGGWNSGERNVNGVRRIPLDGLTHVNNDPSPNAATLESAAGKAIFVIPPAVDATQTVDVLLHLHGHNIGYRERAATQPDPGSVRDVLADQIEDQINQSGRVMVAVLPQGTVTSGFAAGTTPFDCDACIDDVFAAATAAGVWTAAPAIGRVVLSGHSGGGNTIGPMCGESGQPRLPAQIEALFLFEAINGTAELAGVTAYVTQKLNAELQAILASSDQAAFLKSSFRLRAVYNTQDDFYATNYATLQQTIASWFAKNAAALGGAGSDVYDAFAANYVVVNPNPFVAHNVILGSGNLLGALAMLQ